MEKIKNELFDNICKEIFPRINKIKLWLKVESESKINTFSKIILFTIEYSLLPLSNNYILIMRKNFNSWAPQSNSTQLSKKNHTHMVIERGTQSYRFTAEDTFALQDDYFRRCGVKWLGIISYTSIRKTLKFIWEWLKLMFH